MRQVDNADDPRTGKNRRKYSVADFTAPLDLHEHNFCFTKPRMYKQAPILNLESILAALLLYWLCTGPNVQVLDLVSE